MIWSLTLAAVGVLGLFLVGKKYWQGWAINLGAQALWIVYAIATRQLPFIASAVAYGFVSARHMFAWRGERREVSDSAKPAALPDAALDLGDPR